GAEGANAEDMRHGIGIPTLRQHGDGHDAADGATELAELPDRVHDLAKEFRIGDVVPCADVPSALDNLPAKPFDFVRRHSAKVVIERVTCFELLAVDEDRV